jgi:hypothetical protein
MTHASTSDPVPDDGEPGYTTSLDLWLARAAVVSVIALQLGLINSLSFGAHWLAPALETVLLIPMILLSARSERLARKAKRSGDWGVVSRYRPVLGVLAGWLVAVLSAANMLALLALIRALVNGRTTNGRTLLIDAVNVWATNVIVFALWYWGLDRGGPSMNRRFHHTRSDFLFPQMANPPDSSGAAYTPGFVDYLFLSFTTSTAFSPTDTAPLTARMKLLMMLESLISLLTLALVAARAVNILA